MAVVFIYATSDPAVGSLIAKDMDFLPYTTSFTTKFFINSLPKLIIGGKAKLSIDNYPKIPPAPILETSSTKINS